MCDFSNTNGVFGHYEGGGKIFAYWCWQHNASNTIPTYLINENN